MHTHLHTHTHTTSIHYSLLLPHIRNRQIDLIYLFNYKNINHDMEGLSSVCFQSFSKMARVTLIETKDTVQ